MDNSAPAGTVKPQPWLRRHLASILSLVLVIGIITAIFVVYFTHPR